MGELKSKVRYAIHRYLSEELTEERLKEQVAEIIREFEKKLPKKIVCQDVGLIIQEREQSISNKSNKFKRLWALLDDVEPMIKGSLNHWKEAMSK
jgi:FKBP-type peptidyl-prolyl cis-trans isomerase (trigger factor)